MGRLSTLVSLLAVTNSAVGANWLGEVKDGYQCKCYQDNECWPQTADWSKLNSTVEGKLQVALPPAAACHKEIKNVQRANESQSSTTSTFDQAACAEVKDNWLNEQWLTDHPIANLWPLATNNSCLPTDDPNSGCSRGYYGEYVILATKKEHIKAGVDFARDHNLRLIIRNTGHDFMGRATGWGSLIINTHSFKEAAFKKNYAGPGGYTGDYAVVGAGIQGRELYRQAFAQKPPVVVVGGECPTVGWAGGYVQGGGHGPLSGIYGMGADNVLSFEAITASGEYVTANAEKNPDLFWALKGGGPGTFAVVTEVTVKTYPEVPTAGTILNINSTHTSDPKVFDEGFRIFHNLSNHYADHGMFVYFELMTMRLHVQPLVGPNMDEAKIKEVLKPLFDQLDAAKIPYDTVTKAFPTFFELYIDMFEDEEPNQQSIVGGRLFTQKDMNNGANGIADALLFASAPGDDIFGVSVGHIVNPGHGMPKVDNAIHPKWREASSFVITNIMMGTNDPYEFKQKRIDQNTNLVGKALRDASPNGAAYVNEGNLNEPNWQEAYWGPNYPRLLEIRKKYDPTGVFFTQTTPGTEDWEVLDFGTKLCKKTVNTKGPKPPKGPKGPKKPRRGL